MVTIKKVYIEPDNINGFTFEPVKFDKGLNFILGERSDLKDDNPERNKMNGVGKSILVEIIDYCFLKDISHSRLGFLPINLVDDTTYFCMDLEVVLEGVARRVTVKRSRIQKGTDIHIIVDDEDMEFEKLEDARDYLERYIVTERDSDSPSLRQLLSIILRDEKTLYGDIFFTDANSKRFPYSDLLKPHLYLFNFKLNQIDDIKKTLLQKKSTQKVVGLLNAEFRELNISADEVKAHLRDLEDKLGKLNLALEGLAPAETSLQKKQELRDNLLELDRLTTLRVSKEYLLQKIQSLPKTKAVDTGQLTTVYNAYKEGLGDYVTKSFDEVLGFRKEIDAFQNDLVIDKQRELREQIRDIAEKINRVDGLISEFYQANIASQKIDDLAGMVVNQNEKDKELNNLRYKYNLYEESTARKASINRELTALYTDLDVQLFDLSKALESFNEDLSNIHSAIAGNKYSNFELKINPKSQEYLYANYRIKLDGSMGINRIKTFIYDVLLMTNKFTSAKHPNFLIHDNIFAGTGRDDMVKALNYLFALSQRDDNFQYIVTINKDEFESYADDFDFDLDNTVKKSLTRAKPLFGQVYDEIH